MDAPLASRERLEQATVTRARTRWSPESGATSAPDALVIEEPLEIRWGSFPLAVVMRTPGEDLDLATGFALSELLIERPSDLLRVVQCDHEVSETVANSDSPSKNTNVVRLIPAPHVTLDVTRFQRSFYATSSCGICGKQSIEKALQVAPPLPSFSEFSASVLLSAPEALRARQPLFDETGALHGAALCDSTGAVLLVREDIGRHNAVDKIIGGALRGQIDTSSALLVVSGRASFEVIQKALAARIPCVVAVGGVSSLAVTLAERAKMVLVGFARSGGMSIYAGAESVR